MSIEERKIRWGVLGYARIAREGVIPGICRSSNSVFHAIASRDQTKLADCRALFSPPNAHRGYGELLDDPEVDAVYIPLPNSLHQEWTIRAADRGKHVLCEKPLALNAAGCREMIAACAANKVLLMEAFMYRYTDRTAKTLEVLRSGELGEIKFISSTFRFLLDNPASIKFKPELGGGALYDVGCYPVNFTGLVLDQITRSQSPAVPQSVCVQSVSGGGVDLIFSALLKYSSGVVASLNCGFNAQKRVYSEIVGTGGALQIPDTFFDNAGALTLIQGEEQREIPVAATDRYRLEVEDFADAILRRRPPRLSLAETERNMEVLERLLKASSSA
jgi:predicted dehydrogenase